MFLHSASTPCDVVPGAFYDARYAGIVMRMRLPFALSIA